jgi:ribonuclease HII
VTGDCAKGEKLIIGCDEAGIGAISSIFTVCAYACPSSQLEVLTSFKPRDSKAMSDRARRALCADLLSIPRVTVELYNVPVEKTMPQRPSWREAIAQAVKHVITRAGTQNVELLIDGKPDVVLTGYFQRIWGLSPQYVVHGDAQIPVISAASIVAKTERNDRLIDVAKLYPVYGFDEHYGYGTEAHLEAIAVHGICPEHRKIGMLAHYFGINPDEIQEEL